MHLKRILETGRVVRYHSAPIFTKQDNAQHQWGVCIILGAIYPECSLSLIQYALVHDCAEAFTGDVPSPMKRAEPMVKEILDRTEAQYMKEGLGVDLPELTEEEQLALKWADILEGIYYCTQLIQAGDQFAVHIRDNYLQYAGDLPRLNKYTDAALEELKYVS